MQWTSFVVAATVVLWCVSTSADVTIRGRVADRSGQPVPKALVFWLLPPPINSYPPSIDGQADDHGLFELTLKGQEPRKDVQSQAVIIYAEGHGLGVATVDALTKDAGPVTISLPAETDTEFRIVDPDGHVLAGELVEPVIYTEAPVVKLPATFVQAIGRVTDDAGHVRFPALSNLKLRSVRVVSQTFGPQLIERRTGEAMTQPTIQLRPAGRVEVVFDTTNGTMGKCKMLAFTTPPTDSSDPVAFAIMQGALQGAFAEFVDNPRSLEIPALAAGILRFQLSGCSNQEPVMPHWPEKTELKAGSTEKFVVPIEKTVTIRGRVLDRATEKPVPHADIYVYTRYAGCSILTKADAEGRYSCNVLRGPANVSASLRDPVTRQYLGTTQGIEHVVGPDGFEAPDLLLVSRSASPN